MTPVRGWGEEQEVRLTRAEVVVLLELLARQDDGQVTPRDATEQRALWNLECALERVVAPPEASRDPLAEARAHLGAA